MDLNRLALQCNTGRGHTIRIDASRGGVHKEPRGLNAISGGSGALIESLDPNRKTIAAQVDSAGIRWVMYQDPIE